MLCERNAKDAWNREEMNMITISLCMIVKNEERVLARCLDSLSGLMDEIIIVDTGSTDRTIEIAKQYTDQVYSYPWKQDFSAARNYSFSKASKEYIYVADADEVLDEANKKKFADLKKVLLPEIDIVQMYYGNQLQYNTTYNYDKEYRPKLYKRIREFRWVDPLHERVALEPVVYDSEITILHMPENNHGKRDFSLMEAVTRDGRAVSDHLHTMYAKELFITGDDEDFLHAKAFFEKSIHAPEISMERLKEAALVLARCYRLEKKPVKFFKYAMKDMLTESCSEGCYEIGMYYMEEKDYAEAMVWFENAIANTKPIFYAAYGDEYAKNALELCKKI